VSAQYPLFASQAALPEGLAYCLDFLDVEEERRLIGIIETLPLRAARYKAFTAKRRIVSYGAGYDFDRNDLMAAPPVPAFLLPLRARVAAWADIPRGCFSHALVTEYQTGTTLGWHRDAPPFGTVAGISLGTPCRLRFRPYPPKASPRERGFDLLLEPRSAYLLRDAARWRWQHSIPPTKGLRYSITFRTLAARSAPQASAARARRR
jgi:alkylated DNA repair dioxygenase AlkB